MEKKTYIDIEMLAKFGLIRQFWMEQDDWEFNAFLAEAEMCLQLLQIF